MQTGSFCRSYWRYTRQITFYFTKVYIKMNKESRVMLPLRLLEAKVEATNKALCNVSDKRHPFKQNTSNA